MKVTGLSEKEFRQRFRTEAQCARYLTARKASFGSRSDAGAHTRSVLMTVLHTLRKQNFDATSHLKQVLDQLAGNIRQDPFLLFFPRGSPHH
jgi:hypothetical protein